MAEIDIRCCFIQNSVPTSPASLPNRRSGRLLLTGPNPPRKTEPILCIPNPAPGPRDEVACGPGNLIPRTFGRRLARANEINEISPLCSRCPRGPRADSIPKHARWHPVQVQTTGRCGSTGDGRTSPNLQHCVQGAWTAWTLGSGHLQCRDFTEYCRSPPVRSMARLLARSAESN